MLTLLLLASLAVGAHAQGGLPFCLDCDCSPPRNSAALNTYYTITETDPDDPDTTRSCVCHCGKDENEGCELGACGYGLRCLHSKHTHTNGGNICRPLCLDPSEYQGKTYTKCEVDEDEDRAMVVPRMLECSDYSSPVSAMRTQSDNHLAYLSFINPCEMSNANAQLVAMNDLGGKWQIEERSH